MPPSPQTPITPDHLLSPQKPHGAGPMIGTVIVVALLIIGGLYFWGERLNGERAAQDQVPYILSGTTTVTIKE